MRVLFLAGFLAVTAACGAYQFPGGSAAQTGHVSGNVMVYPCAPVEQQGQPCKFAFGAGLQIVFTNGSSVASTTVDANGKYSIDLAAATWKVSFKGIARIISGPATVTVPAGGSVVADYQVDSGIRMPGPPITAS
jgi:type 1 fimbria pilin